MKNAIVNRKSLVVILGVVLMAIGAQGISYGQTADEYQPAGTIELLKDGDFEVAALTDNSFLHFLNYAQFLP